MPAGFSFIQLASNLFGAYEIKRQTTYLVKASHPLKGDQWAGIDHEGFSHFEENLIPLRHLPGANW